ncbi:MAG: ATP-binding protein [Anaerovoracaceae bacterium]
MKEKKYKPRLIDKQLQEFQSIFAAVCVEGPKWCGKTWTSAHHAISSIELGDPEGNFQNRNLAEVNPSLVLEGEKPRLIDEWQEVPLIWDAVRHTVDKTGEKGQFILTGSATPNHKGILHSGAGRIVKLRMRPMSLFESEDSRGRVSLEKLCKGELKPVMAEEIDLKVLIDLIIRGGWPESISSSKRSADYIAAKYLEAIIDDDIYKTDGVERNKSKMKLLLRSLARNESTTASNRRLKNDIKEIDNDDIDLETVSDYLDVFSRLFITDNIKPFSTNLRSAARVKKSEKRQFVDPSLPCGILKISREMLIQDLNTLGFMFESLCSRDLKIYAESFDADVFHYQDYKGREIDVVIEQRDGNWAAIEIKLGANQIDEAAKRLIKLKDEIAAEPGGKVPSALCVVCGLSNAAYQRADGVFVVPITELKN